MTITDGYIPVPSIPPGLSAGSNLDTESTTNGDGVSVQRERVVTNPAVSATGTIDGVDQTVTLEIRGRGAVGASVLPGGTTLTGSLMVEYSCDDGTTWEEKLFHNGDAFVGADVLPETGATQRHYSLFPNPAETHVRVRCSAYTSGSATVTLVANDTFDPLVSFAPHFIDYGDVTLDALNEAVEVSPYGRTVGFIIQAGTLAATLRVQASPDRGLTWQNVVAYSGTALVSSWAVTNPNSFANIIVPLTAAYSKVRLLVSAYTSGSAVARGWVSDVQDSLAMAVLTAHTNGAAAPLFSLAMAGLDGSTHRAVACVDETPVAAAYGLVVREAQQAPTATRTQVADTASDAEILAANTARIGATVFNDSTVVLYLGLGTTTTSTTNYTVQLLAGAYYEVPARFTGQIRGIWASDPGTGGAKVTELT